MKQRGSSVPKGTPPTPKQVASNNGAAGNVEEIIESDSPIAMSSFLATRGEARGLSTKAQVELQEQIGLASKKLQEKWAKLEKDWRNLEKEKKDNASSYGITGGGGPIVELNVGGTDMDVLRADLVRAEDSVLALVFGGRWEGRLPRDSRGRVFVDVAPAVFRKVIGFLVKLGIAKPGKVLELPTLTPEEQPNFDHLVLVLGIWPHVYEGRSAGSDPPPPRVKPKDIPPPAVEPADARRFGRSVATSFAVEEVALEMAEAEYKAARKKYEREVASVTEFAGKPGGFGREGIDDDILELNIGGTVMSTRRSTLCRCPDSVLARMFDQSNEKRAPPFVRDTKGRYFVQYNDYCFAKIIEVLRMKRWLWPPTESSYAPPSAADTSISRFRIFVREDEREDFGSLCSYFFPGSESFILEAVGRAGGGVPRPASQKAISLRPAAAPAPAPASRLSLPLSSERSKHSSRRIDPRKLPSEISVLEIRVGLVRKEHAATKAPELLAACSSDWNDLKLIDQQPNSPDTNILDLGFFASIQSLQDRTRARNIDDLIGEAETAWKAAEPAKHGKVWTTLQACMEQILLCNGVSPLPRHRNQAMIGVQVHPDDKDHTEERTVLWHFETPPPRAGSRVVLLCNLPSIKHQGILFTAVVLCMDDDLLVPPPDAPVGELVTVKGHPPTPSRNPSAVSVIWEKVLQEELLTVGDDEVVRYEHKKYPGPLMTSRGPIMCTG